nr:hypothetical protein B0A51_12442 [Rachicladosporium sp. CCFEE 5018]
MAAAFTRPERLTTLPPELLVEVLILLPIRQIVQLRQVNRHFRQLVDGNEAAITRHSLAYNQWRLGSRHRRLTDFRGLELVDAVHEYYSYYGLIYDFSGARELRTPSRLIRASLRSNFPRSFPDPAGVQSVPFAELSSFVSALQASCTDMHGDPRAEKHRPVSEKRVPHPLAEMLGWNTPLFGDPESLQKKLQNATLLRGPHHTLVHGTPEHLVTWRTDMSPRLQDKIPLFWDHRGTRVTSQILQLPDLEHNFSYCVKTEAMASVFWDAADDKFGFIESPFRQAAVMEELFIW